MGSEYWWVISSKGLRCALRQLHLVRFEASGDSILQTVSFPHRCFLKSSLTCKTEFFVNTTIISFCTSSFQSPTITREVTLSALLYAYTQSLSQITHHSSDSFLKLFLVPSASGMELLLLMFRSHYFEHMTFFADHRIRHCWGPHSITKIDSLSLETIFNSCVKLFCYEPSPLLFPSLRVIPLTDCAPALDCF